MGQARGLSQGQPSEVEIPPSPSGAAAFSPFAPPQCPSVPQFPPTSCTQIPTAWIPALLEGSGRNKILKNYTATTCSYFQCVGLQAEPEMVQQKEGICGGIEDGGNVCVCVHTLLCVNPCNPPQPQLHASRRVAARLCTCQLRGILTNTPLIINNRLIAVAAC